MQPCGPALPPNGPAVAQVPEENIAMYWKELARAKPTWKKKHARCPPPSLSLPRAQRTTLQMHSRKGWRRAGNGRQPPSAASARGR